MTYILRNFTRRVVMFLMLILVSGSALAQEVRDRELMPAFDFTTIQMPVEIVYIKLNGKAIQPGEKIQGDDDWLKGLSFTLKNISDKPIAYVDLGLRFPQPKGFVVYSLNYGVDFSRGQSRRVSSPPAIQPGEILELALTKEKYPIFQRILALGGATKSFDTVPYFIERVCFENEPDVVWEGGNLKRRDPNIFSKFNVTERYVLPASRK
ncbi:MAG TPA: hypothetical protein VGB17_16955 [Pyrinomonadaceae bacterium]